MRQRRVKGPGLQAWGKRCERGVYARNVRAGPGWDTWLQADSVRVARRVYFAASAF